MRTYTQEEMDLIIENELEKTGSYLRDNGWVEVTSFKSDYIKTLYHNGSDFVGFVKNPYKPFIFENRFLMQNKSSKTFMVEEIDVFGEKTKTKRTYGWINVDIFYNYYDVSFPEGFNDLINFDDELDYINYYIKKNGLPGKIIELNNHSGLYFNKRKKYIVKPLFKKECEFARMKNAILLNGKIVSPKVVFKYYFHTKILNMNNITPESISKGYYAKIRKETKEVKPGYTLSIFYQYGVFVLLNENNATVEFTWKKNS